MTNSKKTKGALLSSVVALLLCFAMLLGTTFAWFTDNATTNVNKIQAGTLKIDLQDSNGNSLDGKTLSWQKAEGHEKETVLWEPGCTYNLQPITIKNTGNLALKYKVAITGINGDAKLNEVITWEIGEVALGTEQHLAAGQSHEFTISGTMDTSAGNEYQGKYIDSIAITVYATQDAVEYDSNNNQYDANATYDIAWDGVTTTAPSTDSEGVYHITSAAEFAWVMNCTQEARADQFAGVKFVLDGNVDMGGATISGVNDPDHIFLATFDGQGFTISNFVIDRKDGTHVGLFNSLGASETSTGTVKNLTVKNATVRGKCMVGAIVGGTDGGVVENCHVENVTVYGNKKVGGAVGYIAKNDYRGADVTTCSVKNSTIYVTSDENEYGKVVGYENTGCNVTNTSDVNVTVVSNATYVANGVAKNGSTYYISNAQGLKYCATTFTRSDTTINKTFKLTADIDMSGIEWTPWCNEAQYFGGVFDGQGHTISNLTINDDHTADDGHAVGFIGRLGENANGQKELKNVTFDNAKVSGHQYVGVAVGYNEFGTVDNVRVTNSKVTATHVNKDGSCGDKAGALIGMCAPNKGYVYVTNCSATNCEVKAARHAAQLIGYGYANTTYSNLSATNVAVSAIAGSGCNHTEAGIVSANALVGNGTTDGLVIG